MEYRLYSFINHIYMSPIQHGIQTGHAAVKMMGAELDKVINHDALSDGHLDLSKSSALLAWSKSPTKIICQGGNVAMLNNLYSTLKPLADILDLPFVSFHEDEQSLGGVITCVAVLVPESLYNVNLYVDENGFKNYESADSRYFNFASGTAAFDFLSIIKQARLA